LWYRSCHPPNSNNSKNPIQSLTTPMNSNIPDRKLPPATLPNNFITKNKIISTPNSLPLNHLKKKNLTPTLATATNNPLTVEMLNNSHQFIQNNTQTCLKNLAASNLIPQQSEPTNYSSNSLINQNQTQNYMKNQNQAQNFMKNQNQNLSNSFVNQNLKNNVHQNLSNSFVNQNQSVSKNSINSIHETVKQAEARQRATFFIADDEESIYSQDSLARSLDSFNSDISELDSIYSNDFHIQPPTLFKKSTFQSLQPTKRASLLSVAIQRNAYKKSQQKSNLPPSPQSTMAPCNELSASLQENLVWDHARPFNTTLTSKNVMQPSIAVSFGLW
ncbi:hypothetical protein HDV02_004950, partial [Globomyces sp. JEL0801]